MPDNQYGISTNPDLDPSYLKGWLHNQSYGPTLESIASNMGTAAMAMQPELSIPHMLSQAAANAGHPMAAQVMQSLMGALPSAGGAQEALPPWAGQNEKLNADELNSRINDRNLLYHATTSEGLKGILESGSIIGHSDPEGDARAPKLDPSGNWIQTPSGVSVSRVPKLKTTSYGAPITIALDPDKMPATRPFAELSYQKTKASGQNKNFEFENRTYGQPIPTSAIKDVIIDRSGVPDTWTPFKPNDVGPLIDLVKKHLGIEPRIVESGSEQHSYRSRFGQQQ